MSNEYTERAAALAKHGITTIPLHGKIPYPEAWQTFRQTTPGMIAQWERQGWWRNIGMVTGAASNNIVVIDFDGLPGYRLFANTFPELVNTYTVKTGSGEGMHCYYQVDLLPDSSGVLKIPIEGEVCNIEMKADGKQVVIPPSIHPDTHKPYEKYLECGVMRVTDLTAVWEWVETLNPTPKERQAPKSQNNTGTGELNRKLIEALTEHFRRQKPIERHEWLNVSCPNTAAHKNGDKNYSFSYNTDSGVGNCFLCGAMNLGQICEYTGFNPKDFGGLFETKDASVNGKGNLSLAPATVATAPVPQLGQALPVKTRRSRISHYYERVWPTEPTTYAPIPFPFRSLHSFGGMARFTKAGKLTGIVGLSGGGKTTLLETLVDSWLDLGVSCLVWSPEWDADEFIERAVQRYGGPTVDDLNAHELALYEAQNGLNTGLGKALTPTQLDGAKQALTKLKGWQTDVGYLDFPFLTVNYLQTNIEATLSTLDFKPRVLILDYVQLLHAMDDTDMTMYNLVMRIKAICKVYGLHGVIASQVTKADARGQGSGKMLDGLAARYVNDDAFNLFVTINPDYNELTGLFDPSAVLNVAKNSGGRKGKARVWVDWARLFFADKLHENQTFEGDN